MSPITRRDWLKTGAATLGVVGRAVALQASCEVSDTEVYTFHHDHLLGTSLDLCVASPHLATAEAAEQVVLDEMERLQRLLSVYDPASEVSRVNLTREPVAITPEVAEVLRAYERWHWRTGGAFSGQLGELCQVWKRAEETGELPPAAILGRLARALRVPGWQLDPIINTVRRTTDQPLNLNALGKVYIIGKAAEAVRRRVSAVTGLLINLGGDVVAWGGPPNGTGWAVGIQNPRHHYDNALPIAGLRLTNQAIASSGGYQRFFTIGGQRYSHILDPRTGFPSEGVAAATVVADDGVTANALATTLCVLTPEAGLQLVAGVPKAECLILAADGSQYQSAGLQIVAIGVAEAVAPLAMKQEQSRQPWPKGYQLTVSLELPKITARRYRRPYVAVWIEDSAGKAVRSLGVWGNAPKYLRDLTDWWRIGRSDADLVRAVARATRGPGKYDLVWDGKDDKGNAVPRGTYLVRVEVHREFGAHLRQSGKIDCLDRPVTMKLEKNAETGETVVEFKKQEKK